MTGQTPRSDEELLRGMLDGDEDAFAALYQRRHGPVFRFALQMCGSETMAEDVTQDAFLVLLRTGASFDPQKGALISFLYGVARNQVLRRFERDRRLTQIDDDEIEDNGSSLIASRIRENPLANLSRGELVVHVRQAVLALPTHYREAVVLCDLHEMSYVEAAQIIGCAVGTVRSRLHRGRGMLVEKLRYRRETEAPRSAASGVMKGRL